MVITPVPTTGPAMGWLSACCNGLRPWGITVPATRNPRLQHSGLRQRTDRRDAHIHHVQHGAHHRHREMRVTSRSVAVVVVIPKPAAPPATPMVVEYYNASLDHYFITGIAQEIADLDNGVHRGWVRTGQTFKAYG